MRRLTLICHAATRSQREGRFPVSEEPILSGGDRPGPAASPSAGILCAPERRARETALMLGPDPQTASALRDCDFGAWKGQTLAEIHCADRDGAAAWLEDPHACPHGGESLAELLRRIGEWLDNPAPGDDILAVTHAAVMRAGALHVLQAPFAAFWRLDVQPLSAMDFRFNGRFWTLRSLNAPMSARPSV